MKSLISLLLDENLITRENLKAARMKQQLTNKSLIDLFVELGFVDEETLKVLLAKELFFDYFKPEKEKIDVNCLKLLPYDLAKQYVCCPLRIENGALVMAMSNPLDFAALDDLRLITKMNLQSVVGKKSEIMDCIEKFYKPNGNDQGLTLNKLLDEINYDAPIEPVSNENGKKSINARESFNVDVTSSDESNVIKMVNGILREAVKRRVTDIHIEPQERFIDVRFRIDGVLQRIIQIPIFFCAALIARIKILTSLDIAETRSAQDGRARISVDGRLIDMRISSIPTFFGEKLAIRLLDKSEAKTDLSQLGLDENEVKIIQETVSRPQGLVLCTGPTGAGKTSTLYAALNYVRKKGNLNLITIEDPIEYLMEGVSQIQVNPVKNITFATGLKSILRQDPNVVLVGEIRDRETAEIAFRASLTGHLVLSTLHTNSSIATVTRLMDIGLEPYLIASSLRLIIAQRLIKINCQQCVQSYAPSEGQLNKCRKLLDRLNVKTFYKGVGCEECNNTGFFGRAAVFEILEINDRIKFLISKRLPENIILKEAQKHGFRSLFECGIEKVALGLTTLDEVLKVVDATEEEHIIDDEFTKEIMKAFEV